MKIARISMIFPYSRYLNPNVD